MILSSTSLQVNNFEAGNDKRTLEKSLTEYFIFLYSGNFKNELHL